MNNKEISNQFQEAIKLWSEGKHQEGADILMNLAEHGHLDSISELFYIFLDQKDFEVATYYIDCAKDSQNPTILFLKARLIEERDGLNAAVENFELAANAGHPGAISLLFNWAIEERNIAQAESCLKKLHGHEDSLSKMEVPKTLRDLREEINELRDQLSSIVSVYFALASGRWMRTRNDMNDRYEDEDTWSDFLSENGLSKDEFDRYEQWWNSPAGVEVTAALTDQFIEAISKDVSTKDRALMEDFLRNYANWDDFIRELSECTLSDAHSTNGELSYFAEYAIENGLCDPVVSCPDFNKELIMKQVETWFKNNYDVAQSVLLSAYDEIMKIK